MIYIIRSGKNHFKIGQSDSPGKRLKQLQTGNPLPLALVATFESARSDSEVHAGMMCQRRLVGEWFHFDSPAHCIMNVVDSIHGDAGIYHGWRMATSVGHQDHLPDGWYTISTYEGWAGHEDIGYLRGPFATLKDGRDDLMREKGTTVRHEWDSCPFDSETHGHGTFVIHIKDDVMFEHVLADNYWDIGRLKRDEVRELRAEHLVLDERVAQRAGLDS